MSTRIARVTLVFVAAVALGAMYLAASIYAFSDDNSGARADAAVVLGAAVWSKEPSPVFKERINHAIKLYRQKRIRKIIFTGGKGSLNEPAESVAARTYAARRGVPLGDMLVETASTNTYQNLLQAKRVADANGVTTVLVVSDPLHMKRAMIMAADIGLNAQASPTPTTRYRTAGTQFGQLIRETYFYAGYLIGRSVGMSA